MSKSKVTYKKDGVKYSAIVPAVHPDMVRLEMLKRGVGFSQFVKVERLPDVRRS